MSVEHKAIIIVGMTDEVFRDNFPYLTDDIIEDFVDEFFIDSDSWCGGQVFYAHYVKEFSEGEWCPLNEVLGSCQRLEAIKKYREKMREYGYDVPEHLINFFFVSQVF